MSDYDDLVAGLRAWTKDHDAHVRAAVDLLIWKESWLRRASFVRACVSWDRRAGVDQLGQGTEVRRL
jgi:hypothetical protein